MGGEDQGKLIEEKEQLREERGTQAAFPVAQPSQKGQHTCCFLSVKILSEICFPSTWHR